MVHDLRLPRMQSSDAGCRSHSWREALTPAFKLYAKQIIANAQALAEVLASGGLKLVSGGTDNHLMLADVTPLGLTGRRGGRGPGQLPHHGEQEHDPLRPAEADGPFGIRLGTPALTTRGMKADTMRTIGGWIVEVLRAPDDAAVAGRVDGPISELCRQFPVPGAERIRDSG